LSQKENCYKLGFVFICRRINDPDIPKDVSMRTEFSTWRASDTLHRARAALSVSSRCSQRNLMV